MNPTSTMILQRALHGARLLSCAVMFGLTAGTAAAQGVELPKGVVAVADAKVPEYKRTPQKLYLTPRHAFQLKQKMGDKVLFVDIRTRAEAMYLGMPTVADALIPYMEHPDMLDDWDEQRNSYKWEPNNDFSLELKRRLAEKKLDQNAVIVLLCRSGERSAYAAKLLSQLNYPNVYTIIEGYEGDEAETGPRAGQHVVNGWKNAGLPWTYKLEKSKMYFPR